MNIIKKKRSDHKEGSPKSQWIVKEYEKKHCKKRPLKCTYPCKSNPKGLANVCAIKQR